jgi:hypothetical protein
MRLDLCNPFAPPITFSRDVLFTSNQQRNLRAQNATAKVPRYTFSRLPAEMQTEDQQNHALVSKPPCQGCKGMSAEMVGHDGHVIQLYGC